VPEIEECHGGLSFGHLKETAGMRNSTPFLSTLIVSSLHLELTSIPKNDVRGKTSFPVQGGTGDYNNYSEEE
jgi:hypothetical protein